MTEVGTGGVSIATWSASAVFKRQYRKLSKQMQVLVDAKLKDLVKNPMPPGLRFEKLKGYRNPDVYTIHITGNYKLSLEIKGPAAHIRKVGNHDDIDRSP